MLALIYIKLNKVLFRFNSERSQCIISQSPQGFILDNTGSIEAMNLFNVSYSDM